MGGGPEGSAAPVRDAPAAVQWQKQKAVSGASNRARAMGAPRRRSLRSLGSEREPATLRSHRPHCAGSATLKHSNSANYRWVCSATPPSLMRVPNLEPSSPSLTPFAPPVLFGGHFDDFACQPNGIRFDIGVLGTSCRHGRGAGAATDATPDAAGCCADDGAATGATVRPCPPVHCRRCSCCALPWLQQPYFPARPRTSVADQQDGHEKPQHDGQEWASRQPPVRRAHTEQLRLREASAAAAASLHSRADWDG